jgi:hypothetical protein
VSESSGVMSPPGTVWSLRSTMRWAAGFDEHLVKPADPEELERVLETAGRRQRAEPVAPGCGVAGRGVQTASGSPVRMR